MTWLPRSLGPWLPVVVAFGIGVATFMLLWWLAARAFPELRRRRQRSYGERLAAELMTDPFRPRTRAELDAIVRAQGHQPIDPPSGFGRNLAGELHADRRRHVRRGSDDVLAPLNDTD